MPLHDVRSFEFDSNMKAVDTYRMIGNYLKANDPGTCAGCVMARSGKVVTVYTGSLSDVIGSSVCALALDYGATEREEGADADA